MKNNNKREIVAKLDLVQRIYGYRVSIVTLIISTFRPTVRLLPEDRHKWAQKGIRHHGI